MGFARITKIDAPPYLKVAQFSRSSTMRAEVLRDLQTADFPVLRTPKYNKALKPVKKNLGIP
jgi:hypothetical protein